MEWLQAFNKAAGVRRYVIGGAVSIAVALFDWIKPYLVGAGMSPLIGVPSWVLGAAVALGFVVYWLLERLVKFERQLKGAKFNLARLRAQGVALRNEGRNELSAGAWEIWKGRASKWNDDAIVELRKISEGDAEWFSILDVVPPPRLASPQSIGGDGDDFAMHDFRLKRLGDMIRELWSM
jgi:hypothetical protein